MIITKNIQCIKYDLLMVQCKSYKKITIKRKYLKSVFDTRRYSDINRKAYIEESFKILKSILSTFLFSLHSDKYHLSLKLIYL